MPDRENVFRRSRGVVKIDSAAESPAWYDAAVEYEYEQVHKLHDLHELPEMV
jgi:hypothetical protein